MASQGGIKNKQGVNAKRRNHTVPKALLKRWQLPHEDNVGHWVLDCTCGEISFKQGGEASFAISDYLYVPVRRVGEQNPYRDESVEDWFSKGENDLALCTDQLLAGGTSLNKSKAIPGLIQAAILLGFRSAYEYEMLGRVIVSHKPKSSQEEVAKLIVDHFKDTYSQKLRQFANWDWQTVSVEEEKLLICDRPMFDMTVHKNPQDLLAIPLAPTLMLFATPPCDRSRSGLTFVVGNKTSSKLISIANYYTVERARQFVVGSLEQLTLIKEEFTPSKFKARKATDQLVIQGSTFQKRLPLPDR